VFFPEGAGPSFALGLNNWKKNYGHFSKGAQRKTTVRKYEILLMLLCKYLAKYL
jgi:hypothetical protein